MSVIDAVDEKWLRLAIGSASYSLRGFARAVNLDIATVSRVLTGKRRLQLDEVRPWASTLGVAPWDLLAHFGLNLGPVPVGMQASPLQGPDAQAPVEGVIDAATGEVTFKRTQQNARVDVVALEVVGDPFMAGWRVLCAPADMATEVTSESVGLVKLKDGRLLLRKVRPSFSPGRSDLGPAFGFGEREDGAEIACVTRAIGFIRVVE